MTVYIHALNRALKLNDFERDIYATNKYSLDKVRTLTDFLYDKLDVFQSLYVIQERIKQRHAVTNHHLVNLVTYHDLVMYTDLNVQNS